MSERGPDDTRPDFTAIDGVGRKTAKALTKTGVASLAELARMSVDELVVALAAVGKPTPASTIISKNWLQQAWRISSSEGSDDVDTSSEPTAAPHGASAGPSTIEDDPPEWEEYAGYFIYFDRASTSAGQRWRTRVWDTRNLVEDEFPGTAPGPWITFVLGRASLPASAHTPSASSFEVGDASIEHRDAPEGQQTWLRADIAIDVQEPGALEAAVGSALLSAVVPEMDRGTGDA